MYRCDCCGQIFEAGNDANGIPHGTGWVNNYGYETLICSECIMYRTDRAMRTVEANATKKLFEEDNKNA